MLFDTNRNTRRQRRWSSPGDGRALIFVALFVAAIILVIGGGIFVATKGETTFTVQEKVTKRQGGDEGDQYLIFTDNGVYKNTDTIFAFKWRSSDLQAQLRVGVKYHCTTTGFRFGFTSSYKNLLDCEAVR